MKFGWYRSPLRHPLVFALSAFHWDFQRMRRFASGHLAFMKRFGWKSQVLMRPGGHVSVVTETPTKTGHTGTIPRAFA